MSIKSMSPGANVPDVFNVIIEIPAGSGPVKYEVDKDSGLLMVDRFMGTAMYYPANYGYIPSTLSEDGDPVDVLVLTPVPLVSGSFIACRAVGMLRMEDEKGLDTKLLAVPVDSLTTAYQNIRSIKDVSSHQLDTIAHFFEHYKDLEKGKWVKISGWEDIESAKAEILASVERFAD